MEVVVDMVEIVGLCHGTHTIEVISMDGNMMMAHYHEGAGSTQLVMNTYGLPVNDCEYSYIKVLNKMGIKSLPAGSRVCDVRINGVLAKKIASSGGGNTRCTRWCI